jgi:hypothetical protein
MTQKRAARIERRKRIALAYVLALGADLIPLPPLTTARAVSAAMPDVTESEVFAAARWAIGQSKRSGARFERAWLRASRSKQETVSFAKAVDPEDDAVVGLIKRAAGSALAS